MVVRNPIARRANLLWQDSCLVAMEIPLEGFTEAAPWEPAEPGII